MNLPLLLAAVGNVSGKGEGARYLQYLKDPVMVVLAIVPLAVGFFIWAKASSRKRRHLRRRHHHHLSEEGSKALVESWKIMRESRSHRKRRHHRQASNPTLAETGGLPPRRKPRPGEEVMSRANLSA